MTRMRLPDYRRIKGQLMVEQQFAAHFIFYRQTYCAVVEFEIRQSVPELMQLAQSTTGVCYRYFPNRG